MKTLIFPLAIAVLLSSCSKYQMNMVSSTNTVKDDKTGKFSMENDSVKVVYSFSGANTPMHIDVFNKLNEPLYIDWQRSALIANGKSLSYADRNVPISGDVSGSSIGSRSFSYSSGNINAVATLPKDVAFVPPHAQVDRSLIDINKEMPIIPVDAFVKTSLPTNTIETKTKVTVADFTKENSPLFFKSYLTFYTLRDNIPRFITVQNDFFISKIVRSGLSPESFEIFPAGRGDFFYSSQPTNYSKVGAGVVVGAALVSIAVMNTSVKGDSK